MPPFHGSTLAGSPRRTGQCGALGTWRRYIAVASRRARLSERLEPGPRLSIPNLITLGRIILVPVVVWAIMSGEMLVAFVLFLAAGISDAVDGFLAKRFHMASELGAYLDPLADKALIVSIYVALGIAGALPISLVILVVSRDIMIISAFMLSWADREADAGAAAPVSKANTAGANRARDPGAGREGFRFDASLAVEESSLGWLRS